MDYGRTTEDQRLREIRRVTQTERKRKGERDVKLEVL